ncbi:MAG: 2-oxoacid:acceptor oxidoreductase subunit alpha [Firmicutes bacterium]|nr:2-oxoacid:acceptor oxidoreductase subunit alpha [Bacillota bacterium]
MLQELSWKVGGQQGEGIDSTGNTFSKALNRMGYFIYSYRHFSSRIKGGHTNDKVRVSVVRRLAGGDHLDILLAFDQESIDFNCKELRDGGIVIADSKFSPKLPDGLQGVRLFSLPLTKLAEGQGAPIMKNMVALGATVYVMGLNPDFCSDVIEERFGKKSPKIVEQNMAAVQAGYDAMKEAGGSFDDFRLAPPAKDKHLFLMGNDALALGAMAGGARVMPAYPITPASDVMEYLIKKLPKVGGVVVQTEDEIAALNMTIGAAYGGARALTATSGPGLALMMEAIGLSGMTETPVVIIDTQRGGPSTGLPTKHEQSDMFAALFGNHGEIPKIVLAPATTDECYTMGARAFNLAEKYQVPTIVLTDLTLSLASQSTPPFEYQAVPIERGNLATEEELAKTEPGQLFKRYARDREDGLSPRAFPGQKGGIHHVTGVEHSESGRPDEGAANHTLMMNKRLQKLANVELDDSFTYDGPAAPDLLLVGIGSSYGPIGEAVERLAAEGLKIGHLHVRVLSPLPVKSLQARFDKAGRVQVIESNATGQLLHLFRMHGITHPHMESFLKYDGTPFLPKEIVEPVKESMLAWQR